MPPMELRPRASLRRRASPPPVIARAAHILFHIGTCCLMFGLTALGVMSILAPAFAGEMYGVRSSGDGAWVAIAGLRDIGIAACTLAIYMYEPRALRAFCPALLTIPIGDAMLTLKLGGTLLGALTHLGGVVAIGVLTACAWLDPALDAAKRA